MPQQTNKINFVQRLNKAILACRRLKKVTDDKNAKMLRAYASGYYQKGLTQDPHPINLIDRAVSIWLPFLVGGLPKIVVRPKINLQLKPFAYTFQLALNHWLKAMKFAQRTLQPAVLNSLFGMGIVKTGTCHADIKRLAGYLTVEGRPYAEVVDEQNYVFDITAKDREQYEFEGDEYILPTEEAKEEYPKFADKITPDFKLYGEDHPKTVVNPDRISYNELHDYTRFIDLWLPREKVIITILPPEKGFNKIIKTIPYDGPESGPYDCLGYKYMRGSTLPIPPIYGLMELDAAINTLFVKARNQAERLKKVGVYEGGSEQDAMVAKEAKDGDMLGLSNAQSVKELTLGGVVPELYDFLAFTLAQFSEQGGNLFTTGGLRTAARTLGQEQLLMANASKTLDMMSQTVHYFASSIAEKLAYEMWQNPTIQIATIKNVAGEEIASIYNQLQQEGEFTDYYLDIELFSMQRLNPEARFQRMMQLLTGWILPTMQVATLQGQTLNIRAITQELATYMDVNTDSWFLPSVPTPVSMNPYQQMGLGMRSSDQRFGASEADNLNNKLAAETARLGKTTKEISL